jgi:hypothetical protein
MTRADLLTLNGVTQSITEWALDYGITPDVIMQRLRKGKTVEAAITRPTLVRRGMRLQGQYLQQELAKLGRPGVVPNLSASKGTGAGSTAQEIAEITFPESEASR